MTIDSKRVPRVTTKIVEREKKEVRAYNGRDVALNDYYRRIDKIYSETPKPQKLEDPRIQEEKDEQLNEWTRDEDFKIKP